jgi:hypothetical protein
MFSLKFRKNISFGRVFQCSSLSLNRKGTKKQIILTDCDLSFNK